MGKQNELTFEFALFAFKAWMGFLVAGVLPDSKRFNAEFMEHYPEIVNEQAPLVLMFSAFVGAIDSIDLFESERFNNALKGIREERKKQNGKIN
ncbi:MAG: hypothetical protein GX924_07255 [Clostridiaceae bacterium]|nr:hypothetical protein [Clostridiaceae bacterium]